MPDFVGGETVCSPVSSRRSVELPLAAMRLWRQRWGWAGGILLLLGFALTLTPRAERTYTVTARMLVQPTSWPRGSAHKKARFLAQQTKLIRSSAVIKSALANVEQTGTIADADKSGRVLSVRRRLTAHALTGKHVLRLDYRCPNVSAGISTVEAILASYQHSVTDVPQTSRVEQLEQLTGREEELRGDIEARQARYRQLRSQGPQAGARYFHTIPVDNLRRRVTAATSRRIELQSRIAAVQAAVSSPLVRLASQADSSDEAIFRREEVAQQASSTKLDLSPSPDPATFHLLELARESHALELAEDRLAQLARIYTQQHPDVLALKAHISGSRRRLQTLTKQVRLVRQHSVVVAEAHEARLTSELNAQLEKVKAHSDFLAWNRRERDGLDRLKADYDILASRFDDWRLVDPRLNGGWRASIVILDPPGISPGIPGSPRLLGMGSAIVLLVGFAVVLTQRRINV